MTEQDQLKRWATLYNLRGFAGAGARESEEEKLIVERSVITDFVEVVRNLLTVEVLDVSSQQPPLPDFSARVTGNSLGIELTEFIDPKLLEQAKYIKKTIDHPLNEDGVTGGLWFKTDRDWFHNLLWKTIESKELKYQSRETKIDVLVIWNEALQIGIESTGRWLQEFKLPELTSISSIYFQSWYHPDYIARPMWSIKSHPLIGEAKATRITD